MHKVLTQIQHSCTKTIIITDPETPKNLNIYTKQR